MDPEKLGLISAEIVAAIRLYGKSQRNIVQTQVCQANNVRGNDTTELMREVARILRENEVARQRKMPGLTREEILRSADPPQSARERDYYEPRGRH